MAFLAASFPLLAASLLASTPGATQEAHAEQSAACSALLHAIESESFDMRHPSRLDLEVKVLAGFQGLEARSSQASSCRNDYERGLRELSLRFDQGAREARSRPLAEKAERLYATYLAAFGDAPESYPLQLSEARLLHDLHRYADSAEAYRRAIVLNPRGVGSELAARMSIVSASLTQDCGVFESWPKPRTEWPACLEREMRALDFVLEHMPDSSIAPHVRYRRAVRYRDIADYAHAIEGFEDILARDMGEDADLVRYAAVMLLDALLASGRSEEAKARALRLRETDVALSAVPEVREMIAQVLG